MKQRSLTVKKKAVDFRVKTASCVGVCQGCLLSPILFNISLKRLKNEARKEHEETFSIRGRIIPNFPSADNINGLMGQKQTNSQTKTERTGPTP